MDPSCNSSFPTGKKTKKKFVSSSAKAQQDGKSSDSSATAFKPHGKAVVSSPTLVTPRSADSSAIAFKPHGKAAVSSATPATPKSASALHNPIADQVLYFKDVTLGPHEASLRFHLIHIWEAINLKSKNLIGQEMLLIDEEGTPIQGFVPAGRVGTYDLVPGAIYNLTKKFGSRNKDMYHVADHQAIVTFSWNFVLSALENHHVPIEDDRFMLHSVEEFEANCDAKGGLFGELF